MQQSGYSSTYIATATTTAVATGQGILHAINITETAAGTITVYDNTAASGTIIAVFKASIAENSFVLDASFTIGCTIVTDAASKLTATWVKS